MLPYMAYMDPMGYIYIYMYMNHEKLGGLLPHEMGYNIQYYIYSVV